MKNRGEEGKKINQTKLKMSITSKSVNYKIIEFVKLVWNKYIACTEKQLCAIVSTNSNQEANWESCYLFKLWLCGYRNMVFAISTRTGKTL